MTGGGTAANYELRSVGPDGLFNTSDDVILPLGVSYSGDTATLTFAALTQSVYRLTVKDAITNVVGVALDGNGAAGGNWVADFVVIGSGTLLGSATTASVAANPLSVATGDFLGNGRLDLAVASYSQYSSFFGGYYCSGTLEILLNNGNGTFTAGSSYSTDTGYYGDAAPYGVIAGDFNGKVDLVVASYDQYYGSGTLEVFLGNGNGTFTAGSEIQGSGDGTGFNPISIAAGNFNSDGKLDLAAADYSNNRVDVFTGNGDGTFAAAPATYAVGTNPRHRGRRLHRRRQTRSGRGQL